VSVPPFSWYDAHAAEVVPAYEALPPISRQDWLADLIPTVPGLVIDIGAGSGRDAASFAALGHEVLAVEPSKEMANAGQRLHETPRIRWLVDELPGLDRVSRLGLAADIVLLNGVWQHVAPVERRRAFRKLVGLLKSGGLLIVSLRHGADDGRGMHPVSLLEIEQLGRAQGMQTVRVVTLSDPLGRPDVEWVNVVLRLPDDGTGALPLLRHLILSDTKSATYKLGLLRAICRAADGSAGLAIEDDDQHVSLPLGLIALNWLRLYLPLVRDNLPQMPRNTRGAEGLAFAKEGWHALAAGAATDRDLRVGAELGAVSARAITLALREAAEVIQAMPANYLTYPQGGRILQVTRSAPRLPNSAVILDGPYLYGFGTIRIPRHLWKALQRFAVWIEPALVTEWARLMRGYAIKQGRQLDETVIAAATTWSDPERDVALPRSIALSRLTAGDPVHCVWSGKRLETGNLDIDHILPWSAWPCGDLWNLVPADRKVNQSLKRDKLPSSSAMTAAAAAMEKWWSAAYLRTGSALPIRFVSEARASLPGLGLGDVASGPEAVYNAICLQRLRLSQDQGMPEWQWKP
jgi:SAM-dependent methyltransferase